MKKEHEPQVQAARICFNPTFGDKTKNLGLEWNAKYEFSFLPLMASTTNVLQLFHCNLLCAGIF